MIGGSNLNMHTIEWSRKLDAFDLMIFKFQWTRNDVPHHVRYEPSV
jgi:hypothetical protein